MRRAAAAVARLDLVRPLREPSPMPDLQTPNDVRTVVRAFYRDMEADPVLGPYLGCHPE
jgi:hypothetical protein